MLNQNHTYNTRAATYHFLDILQVKTTHFGQYSVKFQASETWNNLQRTQNLYLLTSEPSEYNLHCSRHILPNTAITPRAFIIHYILQIFFNFHVINVISSGDSILDYSYDNYFVKYIEYCYCYYFYCYFYYCSYCKRYYHLNYFFYFLFNVTNNF